MHPYTVPFDRVSIKDVPVVGGKNASLGEMIQQLRPYGIRVPDGFAITSFAYWEFLDQNQIRVRLHTILNRLDTVNFSNLAQIGLEARQSILQGTMSYSLQVAILAAYQNLIETVGDDIQLAVRSSATAEDLPSASFAGQQESYLNIHGEEALLEACLHCYASLFTDRAIKYRVDHGFDHMQVALSVGVQQMVRSDLACSGVGFTIEPESGFANVVVLNGAWGLGELVVKGKIDPDEFVVFKPNLDRDKKSILSKKLGKKQQTMVYATGKAQAIGTTTRTLATPRQRQEQYILSDDEIETLARWAVTIESHYNLPMDIEWAKDGKTGQLYLVQARPETVRAREDSGLLAICQLTEKSRVLCSGAGLGNKIAAGRARILQSPDEGQQLLQGEVLVTDNTDPDWDPILKKAAAVITNRGGRTSHAAIVARELGAVAVVGAGNATEVIKDGQEVTVSSAEGNTGYVYEGLLKWEEQQIDLSNFRMPATKVMLILGDPEKAFHYARLPNHGIGLMRMEFIINHAIQIHPMALIYYDQLQDEETKKEIALLTHQYRHKPDYFINRLAEAVGTIAAAFYPKEVIVRMSDFKSNEYANLIGGRQFEPREENPMLGYRGASRYYHENYRAGFKLECEAMKVVRNHMGFKNVKLMIPFCRTVEEGRKVIDLMADYGLIQGNDELEIYVMIEIPSNVILAKKFARIFNGFSIGSNDLTQLTLGLDRDNSLISELFDENDEAVKTLIASVIKTAKSAGIPVGLCGQAPSDFPQFAQFLVKKDIDSISFNADALLKGIENVCQAEANKKVFKIT